MSPAEVALFWITIGSGAALAVLGLLAMAEAAAAREVRHPYREDIPDGWG